MANHPAMDRPLRLLAETAENFPLPTPSIILSAMLYLFDAAMDRAAFLLVISPGASPCFEEMLSLSNP
jgi:hypothetical protein